MATKTYDELLDEFEGYNDRNRVATLLYEEKVSGDLNFDKSITIDTTLDIVNLSIDSIGLKVFWMGYYSVGDGGSNWGVIKQGTHTADGGSIFTISGDFYIEANIKGKRVNALKFGASTNIANNSPFVQAAINTQKVIYIPEGKYPCLSTISTNNTPMMLEGDGMDKSLLAFSGEIDGLYANVGLPVFVTIKGLSVTTDSLGTKRGIHINCGSLIALRNRERRLFFIEDVMVSGDRYYSSPALAPVYNGGWLESVLCANTDFLRIKSLYIYGYANKSAPLNTEAVYWAPNSHGFQLVGSNGGSPTNIDIEDLMIRNCYNSASFTGEMEGITLRKSEAGICRRGFYFNWSGTSGETNPGLFYHDNHSNCAEFNIKTVNVYEAKIHDCEFYRWRFVHFAADGTTPTSIDYNSVELENGTTINVHDVSVLGANGVDNGVGSVGSIKLTNITYSHITNNTFKDVTTNVSVNSASSTNNEIVSNSTNNDADVAVFSNGASENNNFVRGITGLVNYATNASAVTVTSSLTDIATLSPSIEANVGDVYKVTIQSTMVKGATAGKTTLLARKVGGTGSGAFIIQPKVSTPVNQTASQEWTGNAVGMYKCSAAGSLGIYVTATSEGSNSTATAGLSTILVEKIR